MSTATINLGYLKRQVDDELLMQIKGICQKFSGKAELEIILPYKNGKKVKLKSKSIKVDLSDSFKHEIEKAIGEGNFSVSTRVDV